MKDTLEGYKREKSYTLARGQFSEVRLQAQWSMNAIEISLLIICRNIFYGNLFTISFTNSSCFFFSFLL